MSSINKTTSYAQHTHEGAPAISHLTPYQQLRRTVLSCLLWENQFYEDGVSISNRIEEYAQQVTPEQLSELAIECKDNNLRHVPLLLSSLLVKYHPSFDSKPTIINVIRRADELTEFMAIYWKDGRCKVDNQVKKALAKAFNKFNAYQLGKYNRNKDIKLRDVLRICHAKPKDDEQSAIFKKILDGTLESPDSWEVALSIGKDKKETFTRLLEEKKLGYLALLRNLRGMVYCGVDISLIKQSILKAKGADKVLPFRFIMAARACPQFEPELDKLLLRSFDKLPKLTGKTVLIIDVSGSMQTALSNKSDMSRLGAACALSAIVRGVCENPVIYATGGNDYTRTARTQLAPARYGMALVDAISSMMRELGGGGIFLKQVMDYIESKEKDIDRIIVITDEQDCSVESEDSPLNAKILGKRNYMINVASCKNGIGYNNNKWTHIDGFSENVIKWIYEYESINL